MWGKETTREKKKDQTQNPATTLKRSDKQYLWTVCEQNQASYSTARLDLSWGCRDDSECSSRGSQHTDEKWLNQPAPCSFLDILNYLFYALSNFLSLTTFLYWSSLEGDQGESRNSDREFPLLVYSPREWIQSSSPTWVAGQLLEPSLPPPSAFSCELEAGPEIETRHTNVGCKHTIMLATSQMLTLLVSYD